MAMCPLNSHRVEFNFLLVTGKYICFQKSSIATVKWLTRIHDEAVHYIHYSYKHYEVLYFPLKCISNNKYLFYWQEMNLTLFLIKNWMNVYGFKQIIIYWVSTILEEKQSI